MVYLRFLTTAVFAILTLSISAQQTETLIEKAERLAKVADSNRQDWQAQYDAGNCYLDSIFSASQFMEAETYLRRALDIAQAQEVKRDTILGKTLIAMSSLSSKRKNYKESLDYHKKAVQSCIDEFGLSNALIPSLFTNLASYMSVLSMSANGADVDMNEAIKLLHSALYLYSLLPEKEQYNSREDIETATAIAHEIFLIRQQDMMKDLMKDNVWLWTNKDDGKKYIVLAFDNWTLEYPIGFFATLLFNGENERKASDRMRNLILIDEQGNVSEVEHGQIDFNYAFTLENNKFVLNENNTFHLRHVTPERRKELIDALHTFEKTKQVKP